MRYGHGCNDALFTNTVPTSASAYLNQDTILQSIGSFIILLLIMRIPVESLLDQGLE